MELSELLGKAQEEVREAYEQKNELMRGVRRTTKLAKRAIFSIHKGQLDEAKRLLDEAKKDLAEMRAFLEKKPGVAGINLLGPAYQEYSEAEIFLAMVSGSDIPSPDELNVPSSDFLLGLADVIGELRRRALDALKNGRFEEAESCLELMEEIYMELISLDEAQAILSELRRKCDIARRLIEATRGDISVEARRRSLEMALERLEDLLKGLGGES